MGDLNVSRQMMNALGNEQTRKLVTDILADGVDGSDKANIKKLRETLTVAAKSDDNKIDDDEESLLDSLDSTGMFGTKAKVVEANLKALVAHESNANQMNFSDVQITTQDGLNGMFGGEQTRVLKLREDVVAPTEQSVETTTATNTPDNAGVTAPVTTSENPTPTANTTASPTQSTAEGTALPSTTSTTTTANTPTQAAALGLPANTDAAITQQARQGVIAEREQSLNQAISDFQQNLDPMRAAIQDLPDAAVITELKELSARASGDHNYLYNVLNEVGISKQSLIDSGVLPTEAASAEYVMDPETSTKLYNHLQNTDFTPEQANQFRAYLTKTVDEFAALKPPTQQAYQDFRNKIYTRLYVFDDKTAISPQSAGAYAQLKASMQTVTAQTRMLQSAQSQSGFQSISSVSAMNKTVSDNSFQAESTMTNATSDLLKLLNTVEANPAAFGNPNTAQIREQLKSIVELGENNLFTIKKPITDAHLATLNQLTGSLENLGTTTGLDKGHDAVVTRALEAVQDPNLQQDPHFALLKQKPELARYGDLLQTLNAPGNEALRDAVYAGDEAKVNQLLSEYQTESMNQMFKLSLTGLSNFMFGGVGSSVANVATSVAGAFLPASLTSVMADLPTLSMGTTVSPDVTAGMMDLNQPLKLTPKSVQTPSLLGDLNSPRVPAYRQIPTAGSLLNLGSAGANDVRQLFAMIQNQNAETKQQIQANGGGLADFLKATPEMQSVKAQSDAQQAFSEVYQSGSGVMGARDAVNDALQSRTQIVSDLTAAQAHIQHALTSSNLSETDRNNLQEQLTAVQTSMSQVQNGQTTTNGKVLETVTRALQDPQGGAISNSLVNQAEISKMAQSFDPAMANITNILADKTKVEAIIAKLPPEKQAGLRKLAENPEQFSKTMTELMQSSSFQHKELLLNSIQGLKTVLVQGESMTPEALAETAGRLDAASFVTNQIMKKQSEEPNVNIGLYASGLADMMIAGGKEGLKGAELQAAVEARLANLDTEIASVTSEQAREEAEAAAQMRNTLQTHDTTFQERLKAIKDGKVSETALQNILLEMRPGSFNYPMSLDTIKHMRPAQLQELISNISNRRGIDPTMLPALNSVKEMAEALIPTAQARATFQDAETERMNGLISQKNQMGASVVSQLQAAGASQADINAFSLMAGLSSPQTGVQLSPAGITNLLTRFESLKGTNSRLYHEMTATLRSRLSIDAQARVGNAIVNGNKPQGAEAILTEAVISSTYAALASGMGPSTDPRINISPATLRAFQALTEGKDLQDPAVMTALRNWYRATPLPQSVNASISAALEENRVNTDRLTSFNASVDTAAAVVQTAKDSNAVLAADLSTAHIAATAKTPEGLADSSLHAPVNSTVLATPGQGVSSEQPTTAGTTVTAGDGVSLHTTNVQPRNNGHLTADTSLGQEVKVDQGSTIQTLAALGNSGHTVPTLPSGKVDIVKLSEPDIANSAAVTSYKEATEQFSTVDMASAMATVTNQAMTATVMKAEEATETGDWSSFQNAIEPMVSSIQTTNQSFSQTFAGMEQIDQVMKASLPDQIAAASQLFSALNQMDMNLALGNTPPANATQPVEEANSAAAEADRLESELDLAPMPTINSEELFEQWLTETLGIIRTWDEATRKLVMAQIAHQMMEQLINTFYKDKADESSDYHENQIAALGQARNQQTRQVEASETVRGASNSQAVAAQSGEARSQDRSQAFNQNSSARNAGSVEDMRKNLQQTIKTARTGSSPLKLTMLQEQTILKKFDAIVSAASTPGTADDRSAVLGMSAQLPGLYPGMRN